MQEFQNILLEVNEGIATLTINRPKALNALNRATLVEMDVALRFVKEGADVDVLVITGAGSKSFVAGADISEMKDMDSSAAADFARAGQSVFGRLEALHQPVIAAVNGFALGGGCELALACDLILASENARFGQPEVNLGVIPGFGGTQRLARLVGPQRARYLVMTGETVTAAEALSTGMILKVYASESLLEETRKLAIVLRSKGLIAVGLAKKVIADGLNLTLEQGLKLEADAFAQCFATHDQKEGMEAFINKRKAAFSKS